jgi:hypothetical protein
MAVPFNNREWLSGISPSHHSTTLYQYLLVTVTGRSLLILSLNNSRETNLLLTEESSAITFTLTDRTSDFFKSVISVQPRCFTVNSSVFYLWIGRKYLVSFRRAHWYAPQSTNSGRMFTPFEGSNRMLKYYKIQWFQLKVDLYAQTAVNSTVCCMKVHMHRPLISCLCYWNCKWTSSPSQPGSWT